MVDLRTLAQRLGMLQPCRACYDGDFFDRMGDSEPCGQCLGTGRRMPSEAEVRAAIFETKHGATIFAGPNDVAVIVRAPGNVGRTTSANRGEAAPDQLVLLALLRALEVCRGD